MNIPKYIAICIIAAIIIASMFPEWWEGMMNANCARSGGQPVKTASGVTCVLKEVTNGER